MSWLRRGADGGGKRLSRLPGGGEAGKGDMIRREGERGRGRDPRMMDSCRSC